MSHSTPLGKDARGNLIRIDNVLESMEKRLADVREHLGNLRKQQANAEVEKDKLFPEEQELKDKSEQLAQLDAELNLMGDAVQEPTTEDVIANPPAKPSVLESLRNQPKFQIEPKMKRQYEEVL